MSRSLRLSCLAVIATCAVGVGGASEASAAVFTTTSGATITGNQSSTHVLTVTGQAMTCSIIKLEAFAGSATLESIDVGATYEGCTFAGFAASTSGFAKHASEIGAEGRCWYTVNANGSAALKCNKADVTVSAGPCVVHIPTQAFASGLGFTNTTSNPDDIDMSINLQGIHTIHTDGFLCPFGSSGESNSATLNGASTLRSEIGGTQVNLTWE
jgi:hypothetical protein